LLLSLELDGILIAFFFSFFSKKSSEASVEKRESEESVRDQNEKTLEKIIN
jgi:hypothetical protein